MVEAGTNDRRGIYNIEYFSGSQASIYIGDVLIDEVTSISYQVSQSRTPLYGYADQLFRDVSKGVVLVQGQFSINFKEAGYLWLVLDRYRRMLGDGQSKLAQDIDGKGNFNTDDRNIERMINGELSVFERNALLQDLTAADNVAAQGSADGEAAKIRDLRNLTPASAAQGFASINRFLGSARGAESKFEVFEDEIWRIGQEHQSRSSALEQADRRSDDPDLNPFDIFVTFGDYSGSDHHNHTVQKITSVHVISTSKQVVIDGQPIQETYQFLARNIL